MRRPRTLSRQLMLGVSALVTVFMVGVGGLSIYTMHTYVTAMSDNEVSHSLAALQHSVSADANADESLTRYTGQASGTLIAVARNGSVVRTAMFDDDGPVPAPSTAIAALEALDPTSDQPQTVELGELGRYRVATTLDDRGDRLISAVSMRSADEAIAKKTLAVAGVTLLAALLAAAGTIVLVRQALRPLRRVAATAASAATLPLADDDQRITARVRRADSDPDNEVGIVGETLNRLLANVDAALAARAASDQRMRSFLSDASHELRTPLAAIHGYAQLTRQDGASLPDTTEYALSRIEAESRRMSALVADMLMLSRLDEGQPLEREHVELGALIVDAVNDVAVTAPEHRFTADVPDEPVWIRGDRAGLHQVVTNLLTNARNHTHAGTSVGAALRHGADAVELTVCDDGPGIEPEILPDLFGRFVRADKGRSRQSESTGLGLAIVASITRAHGGTVTVESRPGRTEFTVRVPDSEICVRHETASLT